MRILLVCMGNTCRSPMAEALLRLEAARRGLRINVASAGVRCGNPGGPANDHAIAAMQARGIDLSSHMQRQVEAAAISQFDMIIALDGAVRDKIRKTVPDLKVSLLLDFSIENVGENVPDPYGQGPEAYERAVQLIKAGIEGLLAQISSS